VVAAADLRMGKVIFNQIPLMKDTAADGLETAAVQVVAILDGVKVVELEVIKVREEEDLKLSKLAAVAVQAGLTRQLMV
tara:strand:+ start:138 stop:374 length:237 start_codon:yes stop_codon:yes gene_type:complete